MVVTPLGSRLGFLDLKQDGATRVMEAFLGTFSHGTRWTPSMRPRCKWQGKQKPAGVHSVFEKPITNAELQDLLKLVVAYWSKALTPK